MTASTYEREFKSILEAEPTMLEKITKTCSGLEKDNYFRIKEKPFAVIRAAGSLGVDLVAVRGDISFLVEIKSSSTAILHFSSMSGKLQQQADGMKNMCERTRTLPIYAFRLKGQRGDSWRIYTLSLEGLMGVTRIVHQRLPQLSTSKNGNFIMRWDEGLPLSEFIHYLCR